MLISNAQRNLESALARVEAVQSKLQPTIRRYLNQELEKVARDIRKAQVQIAEHECSSQSTESTPRESERI